MYVIFGISLPFLLAMAAIALVMLFAIWIMERLDNSESMFSGYAAFSYFLLMLYLMTVAFWPTVFVLMIRKWINLNRANPRSGGFTGIFTGLFA